MATATLGVTQRPNEMTRPSAKGRATSIIVNHDASTDTALALRMQRLRLLGILGQRAAVIASLAWGDTA